MSLAAVIVTYNRKEELRRCLESLYRQSAVPDRVLVVDNCSTDGTGDWLQEAGYRARPSFDYRRTPENIGGAGGFAFGLRAAYDSGADHILLMDDDGRPCDEHTVERLLRYAEQHPEPLIVNALVVCGEWLTFPIRGMSTVAEALAAAGEGGLLPEAHLFNGSLVNRALVEKIGYPNAAFFIKGDEVDYKHRALSAGATVTTLCAARFYHPRTELQYRRVLGIRAPFFVEAPWKEYYTARNFCYQYKAKRQFKAIAYELFLVKLLAILSLPCPRRATLRMLCRGLRDGWHGRLGPTVMPGELPGRR